MCACELTPCMCVCVCAQGAASGHSASQGFCDVASEQAGAQAEEEHVWAVAGAAGGWRPRPREIQHLVRARTALCDTRLRLPAGFAPCALFTARAAGMARRLGARKRSSRRRRRAAGPSSTRATRAPAGQMRSVSSLRRGVATRAPSASSTTAFHVRRCSAARVPTALTSASMPRQVAGLHGNGHLPNAGVKYAQLSVVHLTSAWCMCIWLHMNAQNRKMSAFWVPRTTFLGGNGSRTIARTWAVSGMPAPLAPAFLCVFVDAHARVRN